jgi:hypothetical protein
MNKHEPVKWWVLPDRVYMTSDELVQWLRSIGPVIVRNGPRQGLNVENEKGERIAWAQPDIFGL